MIVLFTNSDEEAVKLIEQESQGNRRKNLSKWQETDMGSILDERTVLF